MTAFGTWKWQNAIHELYNGRKMESVVMPAKIMLTSINSVTNVHKEIRDVLAL